MAYVSLFFYAIIASLLWPVTLAGNHTDLLSLLAIKKSITHDPQRALDTWNTSLHFCQWQGVTCGRRHPRVTILDLGSRSLVGSLSPHIGSLTFLREIWLNNNSFNGVIPPQLGGLFRLQKLILTNNSFEGEIPGSLSNCSSLKGLRLYNNELVGKIPQELGLLVNLVNLSIGDNRISGGIPSFLGNLTSLEFLLTSNNPLGGNIPDVFGQLHSLKYLCLGTNQLHGMVPPSLYNLTSIIVVELYDNQISGGLSKDIGLQLPNLVEFYISGNKLTGSIPSSLSNCSNLVDFDLSENGFTGKVDINFRHIPNLRFLILYRNNLGSWEPDAMNFFHSMINCSKLEVLLVQDNQLKGVIPQSLGSISYFLRMINMGNNSFHGTIPNTWDNCGQLEGLILNGNKLEGDVPSGLSKCESLKVLDLGNNRLNGTFPHWSGSLPNLQVLILKSNKLHGLIENSTLLKHPFPSLKVLDLSQNEFVGHLPRIYFQNFNATKNVVKKGPKPEYLTLSTGNFYSITIAVKGLQLEFPKILVDYTVIDLSKNRLEGEIPNVICGLNALKVLNLSHNNLNGGIPYALGNLSEVESLDLSWNQLTGEIPQSLADITTLEVLNLSQNHLAGHIPRGTQFNTFEGDSFGENSALCGFPLSNPCGYRSTQQEADENEEGGFTWKVVMLGYGCGTILGLVLGYLMLSTGRPKWFNVIAEEIEHMIQMKRKKRRYVYIGK